MRVCEGIEVMRWIFLGLFVSAATASWAEPTNDALRGSVERKEIVSLISIVQWVESRFFGQVIEVELKFAGGKLQYEVELLTPKGNVIEFEFDARTGMFVSVEGRGVEEARRP